MKESTQPPNAPLNRRSFLKGGSIASFMSMLGAVELKAQSAAPAELDLAKYAGAKVKCAVIGAGFWGREILQTLALQPVADVVAICEKYPAYLRRASRLAPNARTTEDYKEILSDPEIRSVIIATPTHQHRQLVEEALSAGKHVYCEAPIAHTMEDAKAIAIAAKNAPHLVFQPGLQRRSDPQLYFLEEFVRAGALGINAMGRAQWNKKQSWRAASPNPERERELNWRLNKETSIGLIGEIGIHQVDTLSWFLRGRPKAVSGFGSIRRWRDGRDVADTIQTVFEYDGGVNLVYTATLANSFDSEYEILYGTDSAVLMRGNKAWMFKEADAPLLGWEVYARKDTFFRETGVALVANASKQANLNDDPTAETPITESPLFHALASFLINSREVTTGTEDFKTNFGLDDREALVEFLREVPLQPAAGYLEGFHAVVTAIKANEAIEKGARIEFQDEWFELS